MDSVFSRFPAVEEVAFNFVANLAGIVVSGASLVLVVLDDPAVAVMPGVVLRAELAQKGHPLLPAALVGFHYIELFI